MKILKNSLLAVSNPRGNLSVDESMVASSGKKRLKQYMPLKPIKKKPIKKLQIGSVNITTWKLRRWWMKLFYHFLDCTIVNLDTYITQNCIRQDEPEPKKLFYHFLDCTIVNLDTYITQNCIRQDEPEPKPRISFRSILVKQLLGDYSGRKAMASWLIVTHKMKETDGLTNTVENPVRLANVGDHLPQSTTSRRCAAGSTEKKPKRSSVECSLCIHYRDVQ
ncbi:hypothetical protein QE152_g1813 [Popillia japonica]|uniref:PiggyBac transposable element-derived protein domain-containing protein n=1 Tax=Popillia japonica TaxID=7064 RepID=A0AAW1N3B8_POPJA